MMRSLVCACLFLAIALASGASCYAQGNPLTGLLKGVTGSLLDGTANTVEGLNDVAGTLLNEVETVVDTTLDQTGLDTVTDPLLRDTVEATFDIVSSGVSETAGAIGQTLDLTKTVTDTTLDAVDEPLNQVTGVAGYLIEHVNGLTRQLPLPVEVDIPLDKLLPLPLPDLQIGNGPREPATPQEPGPEEGQVGQPEPGDGSSGQNGHSNSAGPNTDNRPQSGNGGTVDSGSGSSGSSTAEHGSPVFFPDTDASSETTDRSQKPETAKDADDTEVGADLPPAPPSVIMITSDRNRSASVSANDAKCLPKSDESIDSRVVGSDFRKAQGTTSKYRWITTVATSFTTAYYDSGSGLGGGQSSHVGVIDARSHVDYANVEFVRTSLKRLSSQWNHAPPGKPPKTPFSEHNEIYNL